MTVLEVPSFRSKRDRRSSTSRIPHDSARLHVQGAAAYIDDIREPAGTLHVAVGMADKARGRARGSTFRRCAPRPASSPCMTAADIPGKNDIAPVFADEPLFAAERILFHGQALFAVVARTRDAARRAARLAKIEIEETKPALSPSRTRSRPARACSPTTPSAAATSRRALAAAPHRLEGQLRASAARSISISKARPRSPFPAKAAR